MTDGNIDTYNENTILSKYSNAEIKDIREQFIINNNMVCHNDKPTFNRGSNFSCIDHTTT